VCLPRWHGKAVKTVLPQVLVGPSPFHGDGLFAAQDLPAGSFVTEYAGEYITKKDADKMVESGTDTHLLSIANAQFMSIDARQRGQFNKKWYTTHHKLGGIVNDALDPSEQNCKYVYLRIPDSKLRQQPYSLELGSQSHSATSFNVRAYIVTTKPVKFSQEFLGDYGQGYYDRHGLSRSQTNRRK
jgi:hypothetical protein